MKSNKIHKILEIITAPGEEGKENWRYDELPGIVGFPEMEITAYCDELEKDGLIAQRQQEGYFSRHYQRCRQAYVVERYKEDKQPITRVELLPQKKTILGMTDTIASIIAGFTGGGLFVLAIMIFLRDNKLQEAKDQYQKDMQQIELQDRKIHYLDSLVKRRELEIVKKQREVDSLSQPPKPKKIK